MTIDRYAKFISGQARIARLDEARDKQDSSIPHGHIGIQRAEKNDSNEPLRTLYHFVDTNDIKYGHVSHGIENGVHGLHFHYHNPDTGVRSHISIESPEGSAASSSRYYDPMGTINTDLNLGIEAMNNIHRGLGPPSERPKQKKQKR